MASVKIRRDSALLPMSPTILARDIGGLLGISNHQAVPGNFRMQVRGHGQIYRHNTDNDCVDASLRRAVTSQPDATVSSPTFGFGERAGES